MHYYMASTETKNDYLFFSTELMVIIFLNGLNMIVMSTTHLTVIEGMFPLDRPSPSVRCVHLACAVDHHAVGACCVPSICPSPPPPVCGAVRALWMQKYVYLLLSSEL